MRLFTKNEGLLDQIRCDEEEYLIWKWHPKNTNLGESKRENAIRFGSSLRVKTGEVAVFVYKQKDGSYLDYIEGPFDDVLKTANLPVISNILGLFYNGDTPFQAEVYFINLAQIIQTKFAIPYFDIYDVNFKEFSIPVAVRGTITFNITDYKNFIKLHRLIDFNLEEFQKQIKDAVCRFVKGSVANASIRYNIPSWQIETKLPELNKEIEDGLKERLETDFGITCKAIDLGAIEIDKNSSNYLELMRVTKDVEVAKTEAIKEAEVKNISDKQRIEAENYEETLRIQREEEQYAKHKETQSANLNAFETEKVAEVGVAGANALGKMGENGAGNINIDSSANGFNPAAMMASMALGGAVGQNIAGTMQKILNNEKEEVVNIPPLGTYYVALSGKATGPFTLKQIEQMIKENKVDKETLIWLKGMPDWVKAKDLTEINILFTDIPPIPNDK